MHSALQRPSKGQWQVLLATWFGMFFDGMDASIFVMVLFPTLSELLHTQSHAVVGFHASVILATFMVGWTVGSAIFGLIADRVGRVRVLISTILLYAVCTALCAFSHNWVELAIYRFFVGCGIGGEITVGSILLAEIWKGPARYWATGVICSSFGFGYLCTALLNYALGGFGWRCLYLVGVIPALLTIYIRLRLKDSPEFMQVMQRMHKEESVSKKGDVDKFRQLFDLKHRPKTLCVMGLAAAAIVGYWAVLSWIPAWINQLVGSSTAVVERSTAAVVLNIGSIISALVFGCIFDKVGRVNSFRIAFAGALLSCVAMFTTVTTYGPALLFWVFMVGFFSEAPFVPLLIYVPELYATKIRSTAFGISVQSGRLFAAAAALMAGQLIALFGGSYAVAGAAVSLIYVVGFLATIFMPVSQGMMDEVKPAERTEPVPVGASS